MMAEGSGAVEQARMWRRPTPHPPDPFCSDNLHDHFAPRHGWPAIVCHGVQVPMLLCAFARLGAFVLGDVYAHPTFTLTLSSCVLCVALLQGTPVGSGEVVNPSVSAG